MKRLFWGFSALCLTAHLSWGQSYTWNTGGPSDFWDTSTANWTGAGTVWVNSGTSQAIFNPTSELIILSTGITANRLTFDTPAIPGYTLVTSNNSTLTLAGTTPGIHITSGASASLLVGVDGSSGLIKTGDGDLTLNEVTTYTGLTDIQAGSIGVTVSNAIASTNDLQIAAGAAFRLAPGTTQTVAGLTGSGVIQVVGTAPTATFGVRGTASGSTFSGDLSDGLDGGSLALIKTGSGTQTLGGSGLSDYSAGTTINGGTLVAAKNSAFGTGTVAVTSGGTWGLTSGITQSNTATIAGTGASGRAGAIDNLSGNNTLTGPITLTGNATIGTTAGSLNVNGGIDLGTFTGTFVPKASAPITVGSAITGSGNVVKNGAGTVTLTGTNTYTGSTTVNAGALIVNGSITGSATNVGNGGTLGGTGSIQNAVSVFNGGTLQAAQSNNLAVSSLFLDGGSTLSLTLGAPSTTAAITVGTTLELGGVLNITDGGGFNYGTYRLIDYGGALTDNGLTVASVPVGFNPGSMSIDTGIGGQVSLIVNAAVTEQYWDGPNGSPSMVPGGSGGSGIWNTTNTNWTNAAGNVNGAWAGQDAVFGGTAGTVTVGEPVAVNTVLMMTNNYFFTSSNGSQIEISAWRGGLTTGFGGDVKLLTAAPNAIVDGTMSFQDDAVLTAGVNQSITGGTFLLQGESKVTQNDIEGIAGGNYTFSATQGGTGGTLDLNGFDAVVDSLASTGGAGVVRNGGVTDVTLKVNQATDTTFDGLITNGGGIIYFNKQGAGTLTLTGTMNTTGTITVDGGTFEVGPGGDVNIGNAGIAVGSAGSGTFTVSGGGKVHSRDVDLGIGTDGFAVITGAGSQWDGNFFSIGRITPGDLQVLNGGVLNSARGYVGSTSTGSATVSGAGSEWNSAAGILVAFDAGGIGTLTVAEGGLVTANQIEMSNGGGTAAIHLDGTAGSRGVIRVGTIIKQGGTATIDAAGGVLVATANTADYLQGFSSGDVTLGTGGLFFHTNGLNVGITTALDGAGGFTKLGTGLLTLSGSNLYTGTTTVSAGTLQLQNGTAIVDTGAVSVETTGILELLSSETIGSLAGSGAVQLGANTLTINDAVDRTFSGVISGSTGQLTKVGASKLTLTGANTYTGLTTISAGTLQIGDNGTTGSVAGDILNDAALIFHRSNDITYGGVISGSGTLEKLGAGALILNGTNTYTGNTTVSEGSLFVHGSIASTTTTVATTGLLGGFGTIGGAVINRGIVSPGTSPGTLTVSGAYTQETTGTLRIEIGGRGSAEHDLLAIGGAATVGGTLQLIRLNGFQLEKGDDIVFLTATGGVNGTFATTNNAFATGTTVSGKVQLRTNEIALVAVQESFVKVPDLIEEQADDLFPDLDRDNELLFPRSLSPNQLAVARALDQLVKDGRLDKLVEYLNQRWLPELPGDFDRLAPEELTSFFQTTFSLADVQALNLQRRTGDLRTGSNGFSSAGLSLNGQSVSYSGLLYAGGGGGAAGGGGKETSLLVAPLPRQWGVFLSGTGQWADIKNDRNAQGYDLESGGFTLGLDYKVTPHFAVGLSAGYAGTHGDLADDGRVSVNGGKLGVYATYFTGGFYTDLAVTGGYNSYDSKRAALGGAARGSTEGGELNVLFGTGYDWKLGALTLGSTATFNYTYIGFDRFSEHGSRGPLDFPDQSAESLRTAFGIKAGYDWKLGGVLLKPELRAAWQHEYADDAYAIDSSFVGGGGYVFTTRGPHLGRDSLLLGAGVAAQVTDRSTAYLHYDAQLLRQNYESHSVTAGLRVDF